MNPTHNLRCCVWVKINLKLYHLRLETASQNHGVLRFLRKLCVG